MKALYAGSFDPFTLGHRSVVLRAVQKYDQVVIAVGTNEAKEPLFSTEDRINLIEQTLKTLPEVYLRQISVISYEGLTVDCAIEQKADVLIRGVRKGTMDSSGEKNLEQVNRRLAAIRGFELKTDIFVQESEFMNVVSSSSVKNLCGMGEYILAQSYVVPAVHHALMEIYLQHLFPQRGDIPAIIDELWKSVVICCRERAWHNLTHVGFMLNMFNFFLRHCSAEEKEYFDGMLKKDVILAVFMHDFVQEPGAADNEESCCSLVRKIFFGERNDVERVCACIMATKHDRLGNTPEEKLIADLDLAILGSFDPVLYDRYKNGIREEYSAYDDETYRKGRTEVLRQFLQRKTIFQTDFFRERYEDRARRNILGELEGLNR